MGIPSFDSQTAQRGRQTRTILICCFLAAVTFCGYWPVRTHDFIYYDDPQFITENPQIQTGLNLRTVRYAFATAIVGNWHPVTTLSHAVDCQLFGVNPRGHHLVNVGFHTLNVVLLFLLLGSLTGALWRSALVAVIFALHPLRVESVAWVAERKDLLAGLFFLVTLWLYAAYARTTAPFGETPAQSAQSAKAVVGQSWAKGSVSLYLGSLLCFALGLMSKPMVVTLPFVLLLLDYWPLQRLGRASLAAVFSSLYRPFSTRPASGAGQANLSRVLPASPGGDRFARLLLEKVPFCVLSLADCLVTLWFQEKSGATRVIGHALWMERLGNVLSSYVRYLGKLIWPVDLAIIYPHPARHYYLSVQWPAWEVLCAGGALALLTVLSLRLLSRRPYFAFGWFWFLGMLVPVIGLVQVGEQAMADRYSYLPMIGPVLTLVWWLGDELSKRWQRSPPFLVVGAGLALLTPLFVLTRHQLRYWQNTLTLFEHAVAVTGDNPSAQFGVGMGLLEQGQASQAMVRFRVALAIDPSYARAHFIMGQLLRMRGELAAAAEQYEAALRSNPADVRSRVNLAGVLPLLGRPKDALRQLEQALRDDPNSAEALNNLAWLLATNPDASLRDGARAVRCGQRACALGNSKEPAFLGTLAAAYAETGDFSRAVATAQQAEARARATGDASLAARTETLLQLYRAGKAYREAVP